MSGNNFYVLCGLPASGKTTFSQELVGTTNSKLYCYDNIPGANVHGKSKEVKQKMYQDIFEDLLEGYNVVLDDLHTQKEWRENLLFAIKDAPCKKILVVITTSLEECLQRNKQRGSNLPNFVIQALNQRYETPTLDEGWDEIIWR